MQLKSKIEHQLIILKSNRGRGSNLYSSFPVWNNCISGYPNSYCKEILQYKESQLINAGQMIELENHYFAIPDEIMELGNNQQ